MNIEEGKKKFIQSWGAVGSKWGINRTMAQVHALLLISPSSLSADSIMEELNISRGNANMNLRALIDWGLLKKEHKPGDRKEYFYAEKDIWKVSTRIIAQRKKRELEPIKEILHDLSQVKGTDKESLAFQKTINDFSAFSNHADRVLEALIKSDKNWLLNSFIKAVIDKKSDK